MHSRGNRCLQKYIRAGRLQKLAGEDALDGLWVQAVKKNCAFVSIKMYNLFIKHRFSGNDCAAADDIQSSLQMKMLQL